MQVTDRNRAYVKVAKVINYKKGTEKAREREKGNISTREEKFNYCFI